MIGATVINNQASQSIAEKLAQLQTHFYNELPRRIEQLADTWQQFIRNPHNDNAALSDMHKQAHSLAGTAGTFGAIAVGESARELEISLKARLDIPTFKEDDIRQITTQLTQLQTIASEWRPSSLPLIPENRIRREIINNLVFLVEDDELLASQLIHELEASKYQVKHFTSTHTIIDSCRQQQPAIIIMDMVFDEGEIAGAEVAMAIKEQVDASIPVIFISVRGDIQARLAAAKAGANRYLTKPLNIPKLIQTVDGITTHKPKDPYRILIIDDEQHLLDYYSALLSEEGMSVKTLSDPMLGLEVINDFDPDLILLDVYMSGCTGPELAQVIRQDDNYAKTPIIFLSTETNFDHQLAAMDLGGDDFLTKPIEAQHLIKAVTARVKRARWSQRLTQDLEHALRESEYRKIALDLHAIVSITDKNGNITFVNNRFLEISGYKQDELIGQNHRILKSTQHDQIFFENMWKTITAGDVWHGLLCNLDKQGNEYWVESTIVPFLDKHGKPYQYVSARTDVTAHIHAEENLRHAKEEAENANRAKSQFLSNMSHELRTPMNAILGFSQLLKMQHKPQLSQTQESYVDEILKASHHLLDLINEILNLSKIEAGRIDLSIESVSIGNLIQECLSLSAPLAEKRNIHLPNECTCIDRQCHVRADRVRLKQSVLNLISNAIKYNSPYGSIKISCEQVNDYIRISVTDTGIGISEDNLPYLFQAFNRLDATDSDIEGTGIGLVITKNIVELMGGSIGVHSVEGKGSTFWIELPHDQFATTEINNDNQLHNTSAQETHQPEHIILYIEDNPANLKLVAQVLARRPQFHLISAHEPFLGIELASTKQPDLILLDINLPGLDGYEVLARLQQNPETSNIPVFAISANAMPNDIKNGLKAGFKQYLTKPINIKELIDAVDQQLIETN